MAWGGLFAAFPLGTLHRRDGEAGRRADALGLGEAQGCIFFECSACPLVPLVALPVQWRDKSQDACLGLAKKDRVPLMRLSASLLYLFARLGLHSGWSGW